MKIKNLIILTALSAIGLFSIALECSHAAKEKILTPKIGIVSVKEVFDNYAMKSDIEKTLAAEGDKRLAELKKLEDTIDADKAALSKRKENSQDYMDMLQALMMKQSQYDAQKEFYQRELSAKEVQEKEKIYRKILAVISDVAKEKGLDMVINRDDNYLDRPDSNSATAPTAEEFILTTKTHKLLYYNPSLDITDSVVVAMNNRKD